VLSGEEAAAFESIAAHEEKVPGWLVAAFCLFVLVVGVALLLM
jgi:hypothetical protein